jgi:hypothetical protein
MRGFIWMAAGLLALPGGSPRPAAAELPGGTRTMTVRAVVDHARHRAAGSYAETPGGGAGLITWDRDGVAMAHSGITITSATEAAGAARALPRGAWTARGWGGGSLDRALRQALAAPGPGAVVVEAVP